MPLLSSNIILTDKNWLHFFFLQSQFFILEFFIPGVFFDFTWILTLIFCKWMVKNRQRVACLKLRIISSHLKISWKHKRQGRHLPFPPFFHSAKCYFCISFWKTNMEKVWNNSILIIALALHSPLFIYSASFFPWKTWMGPNPNVSPFSKLPLGSRWSPPWGQRGTRYQGWAPFSDAWFSVQFFFSEKIFSTEGISRGFPLVIAVHGSEIL